MVHKRRKMEGLPELGVPAELQDMKSTFGQKFMEAFGAFFNTHLERCIGCLRKLSHMHRNQRCVKVRFQNPTHPRGLAITTQLHM